MSKNFNICCPDCFSKNLYKYGKDNTGEQKYRCKTCHRQFTKNAALNKNLIILMSCMWRRNLFTS